MPASRSLAALLAAFIVACAPLLRAEEVSPLPARARAALERATGYLRSLSTEGGYVWRYSPDLKHRFGEGEEAATPSQILVQPPGTPTIGSAFLRVYAVTRERRYLEAARAAALALVRGQLKSGGWDYVVEFDPRKRGAWAYRKAPVVPATGQQPRNVSTYDDDNTQSALRFLLAFVDAAKAAPDERDAAVRDCLEFGLRKLMEAQYPNGGWPQRWPGTPHDAATHPVLRASYPKDYPREQPDDNYGGHYTLNDNTQSDAIRTLLDAHRRTGRADYLKGAQRGADFLLLAQLPEPQPAWAQQYDAAMHPAWARAFEPPSVTSKESARVVGLLLDLYLSTGDDKYLKAVAPAIVWFKRSAIAPGLWARLYELRTNRPIYGDRDKRIHYTLEELSEERRNGYEWRLEFGITGLIERADGIAKLGREKWLVQHGAPAVAGAPPARSKPSRAAELEPRVREIIAALDAQGRWLTPATRKYQGLDGPWIEMSTFDENLRTLADYLEATAR